MRRVKGQAGMSLVEATIILLVLMLLTSVLAPSIFDYFYDAQMVKVKEDCEAIGLSVARLARDVGPCMKVNGALPCTVANRVDVMWSDGPQINGAGFLAATAAAFPNANIAGGGVNWDQDLVAGPNNDYMGDQFTTNNANYPRPDDAALTFTFPATGLGWRGAYLPTPIGPDPWGRKYVVNTVFMGAANDAAAPIEGRAGWNRDVFCLSAGRNQMYESPIGGSFNQGTQRVGDDFIYVIQGATR